MKSLAGQLVTETLEHDGGREVTVYVPPDPAEAVVFAADGGWPRPWTSNHRREMGSASYVPTMT